MTLTMTGGDDGSYLACHRASHQAFDADIVQEARAECLFRVGVVVSAILIEQTRRICSEHHHESMSRIL
jgi:hypothetical protein